MENINQITCNSFSNFFLPEEIQFCIGTFLKSGINSIIISKNIYKGILYTQNIFAKKIQITFRRNRCISVEYFENNYISFDTPNQLKQLRRFYFVHYQYPEYMILTAMMKGIIIENDDPFLHVRKRFYNLLNNLSAEDFIMIGY